MKTKGVGSFLHAIIVTLVLALGAPILVITTAIPAAAAPTGRVFAQPCLNLRTSASSSASVLTCIPYNATITITCTINGSSMSGPYGVTQLWNKTTWNGKTGFVTDAFVYTGTNNAVGSTCGPSGSSTVKRGQTISYNPFAAQYSAECTWYALERAKRQLGTYPYFNRDAHYWNDDAVARGWTVSSTPRVGSIVVFERGIQGVSGAYGHVAWVVQVSGSQFKVHDKNGIGRGVVDEKGRWYVAGKGVSFIYIP